MCKTAQDLRIYDDATRQTRTVTIPAECRLYLSAPAIHYHPKYWPEPDELEPERWLGKEWTKNQDASSANKTGKQVVAADKTRQMRGTLLTFSDGSRVPGPQIRPGRVRRVPGGSAAAVRGLLPAGCQHRAGPARPQLQVGGESYTGPHRWVPAGVTKADSQLSAMCRLNRFSVASCLARLMGWKD